MLDPKLLKVGDRFRNWAGREFEFIASNSVCIRANSFGNRDDVYTFNLEHTHAEKHWKKCTLTHKANVAEQPWLKLDQKIAESELHMEKGINPRLLKVGDLFFYIPLGKIYGVMTSSLNSCGANVTVKEFEGASRVFNCDDTSIWQNCVMYQPKNAETVSNNVLTKGETKMSDATFINNVLTSNKSAAIDAAKLTGAKMALDTLKTIAKSNLPPNLSTQVDSPVGSLLLANLVAQLIPTVTDNPLAHEMAQKALTTAYQDAITQLGIYEIIKQFAGNFAGANVLK